MRKEHNKRQRTLPKKDQTTLIPLLTNPAENAGCIAFKDKKIVIFYSNDLESAPSKDILLGTNEEAIKCVRGLGELCRWTGNETLSRTEFFVPQLIMAYNKFMGVLIE